MPLWTPPQLPPKYIEGFAVSASGFAGNHVIGAGKCRSDDDTIDMVLSSAATINIANVGANGLDVGPSAGGWYVDWVIADSAGVNPTAAIASLSATAPTLPTGYDKKKRVSHWYMGRVLNVQGEPSKLTNVRQYLWSSFHSDATTRVLNAGTATAYTDVVLTSVVPTPPSGSWRTVKLLSVMTCADQGDAVYYASGGSINASAPFRHVAGDSSAGTSTHSMTLEMGVDSNCKVLYKCVPAAAGAISVNLYVLGFTDQV
jgi:hypothetical protein